MVSGFSDKDAIKISTLIYTTGSKAEEIFSSFNLSAESVGKFDLVCQKFNSYFEPKKNVIFKRALFNQRVQEESESVDNFVTSLYSLAADCEYGNLHNDLIRDRIVVGIRNPQLSERMQLDSKLTLGSAIEIVKQQERIHSQQETIRQDSKKPFIEKISRGGGKERGNMSNSSSFEKKWSCFQCGGTQ